MDKKAYIAPQMEELDIETVEMMTSSINLYDEDVITQESQLGRGRRGKWGDLWYEEE